MSKLNPNTVWGTRSCTKVQRAVKFARIMRLYYTNLRNAIKLQKMSKLNPNCLGYPKLYKGTASGEICPYNAVLSRFDYIAYFCLYSLYILSNSSSPWLFTLLKYSCVSKLSSAICIRHTATFEQWSAIRS